MTDPIPLHHGPTATVYTRSTAEKPVALKVFPSRLDRRTLATVERERVKLRALAASAPILPVDGVETWSYGRQALRMELCAESLAALVRRSGPLGADEVAALGHALARALEAAHGAGVLHGGVSPDNVLFRASGEPVLADFGVALREAFPRDPLHAIECVAPETLRTGVVDERTDLYGLGAVLHFALTGASPHPGRLGEQPGERVLRVLGSPVPAISRPDIPIELSTVVARLLAADRAHRPGEAAWVVARLAGMVPRRPADPSATVPVTRAAPRRRPTRRLLAAGGAALAGLSLVAVTLALVLRDEPAERAMSSRSSPTLRTTPAPVRLELAAPVDLGDHVVLTWTSERTLDFAVVVATEGEPSRVLLAERNHTLNVPVDPARQYCFLVRATDGDQVYESRPVAVRGAGCR